MQHISTTPFGRRPVTSGLLAAQALAGGSVVDDSPCPAVDKWQILRDLAFARTAFAVSDRDLAVLAALLSFHRPANLDGEGSTIVYPSNAVLSQRAHGMSESTLRRHLAALVATGLILRHDSPNGKRYAVKGYGADLDRAFGFDLAPLARRAEEIAAASRAAQIATERLRRLRETAVLHLRDCEKLLAYALETLPGNWDALSDAAILLRRGLRRKLDMPTTQALAQDAESLLERIRERMNREETEKMHGNAAENARHIQDSNINPSDLEPCKERARATGDDLKSAEDQQAEPQLPLHLVLRACPDILPYAPQGIRHWHELVATAAFVRGMMGISPDAWDEAQHHMGPPVAAIAVACILQGIDRIAKPGGYLRALARKAAGGAFSPGPMVMALLRAENERAA